MPALLTLQERLTTKASPRVSGRVMAIGQPCTVSHPSSRLPVERFKARSRARHHLRQSAAQRIVTPSGSVFANAQLLRVGFESFQLIM